MSKSIKFQFNVSQKVKDEFSSFLSKEKTAAFFLTELLENYKNISFIKSNYSESLKKVCEIKNLNFNQIVGEAVSEYIKKTLSANKKGLTSHTKSVKADKHIAEIVGKIIDVNNKAKNSKDMVYINQSSIVNWLRNNELPLVNLSVIKRYLRLHIDLLNEHHSKLNIKSSHNRDLFIKKRFNKID